MQCCLCIDLGQMTADSGQSRMFDYFKDIQILTLKVVVGSRPVI